IVRRAEVGRLVPEATRGCASWDPLARIRGRAGHPFAGCGPLPLWGRSGPQSLAGMAPAPTPPAIAAVACARAGRQTPMPGAPNPARRKPADGARREDTPDGRTKGRPTAKPPTATRQQQRPSGGEPDPDEPAAQALGVA